MEVKIADMCANLEDTSLALEAKRIVISNLEDILQRAELDILKVAEESVTNASQHGTHTLIYWEYIRFMNSK